MTDSGLEDAIKKADPFASIVWPHLRAEHQEFVMGGLVYQEVTQRSSGNLEVFLRQLLTDDQQQTFYETLAEDKFLQLMYLKSISKIADIFQKEPHLLERLILSVPVPNPAPYDTAPDSASLGERVDTIERYSSTRGTIVHTVPEINPRLAIRNGMLAEMFRFDPEETMISFLQKAEHSNDLMFKQEVELLTENYQAWLSLDFTLADRTPILNQNFKNSEKPIVPHLYQRMDVYNFLENHGWNVYYPTGKGKTAVPLWATILYWDSLQQQGLAHNKRSLIIGPPSVRETWYKAIVGDPGTEGIDTSVRLINQDLAYGFLPDKNIKKQELKKLVEESNFFFISHHNLRRKIGGTPIIDILQECGYDTLILDEVEDIKSSNESKIFGANVQKLAQKATSYDENLKIPVSVLTPNPLADKIEDLCRIASISDNQRYPTPIHVRDSLRQGGVHKAFYIVREKGFPLPETGGVKVPPKLHYILPVIPSEKVFRISKYILDNRKRNRGWITQLRYLSANPFFTDRSIVRNTPDIQGEFELDDLRKTKALIDIFTSELPYINPLERGEKSVIFSPYFREGILTTGPSVIDLLQSAIQKKYQGSQEIVGIHGLIEDNRNYQQLGLREELFKLFQTSSTHNILFLTSGVGGVSRDLSAANNIFVLDPADAVYLRNQQEGRCWRDGQTLPVNIYYLMMQDPFLARSRIRDLDDTVNYNVSFAMPFLNKKLVVAAEGGTASIDEATAALVAAKEALVKYGFLGVMPGENLLDILEGKKQHLMLSNPDQDAQMSAEETRLLRGGRISFEPTSVESVLGNSMDIYFAMITGDSIQEEPKPLPKIELRAQEPQDVSDLLTLDQAHKYVESWSNHFPVSPGNFFTGLKPTVVQDNTSYYSTREIFHRIIRKSGTDGCFLEADAIAQIELYIEPLESSDPSQVLTHVRSLEDKKSQRWYGATSLTKEIISTLTLGGYIRNRDALTYIRNNTHHLEVKPAKLLGKQIDLPDGDTAISKLDLEEAIYQIEIKSGRFRETTVIEYMSTKLKEAGHGLSIREIELFVDGFRIHKNNGAGYYAKEDADRMIRSLTQPAQRQTKKPKSRYSQTDQPKQSTLAKASLIYDANIQSKKWFLFGEKQPGMPDECLADYDTVHQSLSELETTDFRSMAKHIFHYAGARFKETKFIRLFPDSTPNTDVKIAFYAVQAAAYLEVLDKGQWSQDEIRQFYHCIPDTLKERQANRYQKDLDYVSKLPHITVDHKSSDYRTIDALLQYDLPHLQLLAAALKAVDQKKGIRLET